MKLPFLNMSGQHLAWIRGGSAREPLAGEKRGNQVHILGMMMESQKKNGISLVNCLFGGWEAGKEKQSLFQASQDWLATHPGNMD